MKKIYFSQSLKHSNIKVFYNVCDGNFTETIHSALQSLNITKLCELQEYLIPAIMERKYDIFIESHTGTGKKFGYVLPIVDFICKMHENELYQDNGNPFAIILMNDIESCKKVISEITRLYSGARIIKLIGSDKEVKFIKEINNGCDIIVGSIIKFVKMLQPINFSLLKKDILKINFLVIDECEKFLFEHWKNYLKIICNEIFKEQISDQIKIFSTCGLENYTAEMFMNNYAQKDYVIMKFLNSSPLITGKPLVTFPIINESCFSNDNYNENLSNSNLQNSVNYPGLILTQPQQNIVVNNYTNNQQFTSNCSYNNYSSIPIRHSLYALHNDSLYQNYKEDIICNVRYNPFRAQLVNPNLTVHIRPNIKNGLPLNFQLQKYNLPEKEKNKDEADTSNNFNNFTHVGILRRLYIITIQFFDAYKNLLVVLKHLFNENINYKVIVFVKQSEGCNYGSNLCNNNGIISKAITRSQDALEKNKNVEYFKCHNNIVLFVEDNYYELLTENRIYSHIIITLNLLMKETSIKKKTNFLGDIDKEGGIFIIMKDPKIIQKIKF